MKRKPRKSGAFVVLGALREGRAGPGVNVSANIALVLIAVEGRADHGAVPRPVARSAGVFPTSLSLDVGGGAAES